LLARSRAVCRASIPASASGVMRTAVANVVWSQPAGGGARAAGNTTPGTDIPAPPAAMMRCSYLLRPRRQPRPHQRVVTSVAWSGCSCTRSSPGFNPIRTIPPVIATALRDRPAHIPWPAKSGINTSLLSDIMFSVSEVRTASRPAADRAASMACSGLVHETPGSDALSREWPPPGGHACVASSVLRVGGLRRFDKPGLGLAPERWRSNVKVQC
jgi:hypothetical protein